MYCFSLSKVQALVPLESLLLGDFTDQYQEDISDPLYYIFRDIKRDQINLVKQSIDQEKYLKFVLYRGMIDEGHNLIINAKIDPQLIMLLKMSLIMQNVSILLTFNT